MALRWPRALRRLRSPRPLRSHATRLRRALHHALQGHLGEAEDELAGALQEDSSSHDVSLALATLYRARGEVGRAIQIHQTLLLRPGLEPALRRECLLGLALDFRSGGFVERAKAAFEGLIAEDPGHQEALVALEHLYVDAGEWEEALRIRRRIGRSDPRTPRILAHLWSGLGRAHAASGRKAEARRAFRKALTRDPTSAAALVGLGDLRHAEGQLRKAIGLWLRALPLHPAAGGLLYPRLWEAHVALGDLASFEARVAGFESSDVDPEILARAAIWRARARVRLGRVYDAIEGLRQRLDLDPERFELRAEIGRILLDDHRDLEARKAFEELLAHAPRERPALVCRACGARDAVLHWRCPQCGEWDSVS
ncbi:MAG: tetratricopeptide repeat protein [Myxococcota bacterium]